MGLPAGGPREGTQPDVARLPAYVAALVIAVFAILSQYFLPQLVPLVRPVYASLLTGLLVVYGIPIVAFAVLIGAGPLRSYFANAGSATVEGIRWYGAMGILGLLSVFVIVAVLSAIDPSALSQLSKLSPPLEAAKSDPWFWVGFSFVVGIVEETIFRGWIFGYWLLRQPSRWLTHAVWTSLLFASLHLYYGTTYGVASAVAFAELFFAGLGFAAAVRYSRGNLFVVGLLHGAHDALSFATLVWNPYATELYYLLIVVGALVFLVVVLRAQQVAARGPITPWQPGPAPPPTPAPPGTVPLWENPAIAWPPPPPEPLDRPPLPSPPPPSEPGRPPGT